MKNRIAIASSNEFKAQEIASILGGHNFSPRFVKIELQEIQSDSLEQIASRKAKDAYLRINEPVIVEDDGLFIGSLKGFPGPYSSFVFRTIGCEGILRLLLGDSMRDAYFQAVVAYYDGKEEPSLYTGEAMGRISDGMSEGGWGFDPVFVPTGSDLSFAQMGSQKNRYSHRRRALEKFALHAGE